MSEWLGDYFFFNVQNSISLDILILTCSNRTFVAAVYYYMSNVHVNLNSRFFFSEGNPVFIVSPL